MKKKIGRPFQKGSIPWNKHRGKPLGTITVINFPTGKRRMIKVKTGTNNNFIRYSRYIMEKCLGRKLTKDEVVHHIDGNKLNDDIKNLEIKTNKKHLHDHWKGIAPVKAIKNSLEVHRQKRLKNYKKIKRLREQGLSWKKMKEIIGLSANTMRKSLKEFGGA